MVAFYLDSENKSFFHDFFRGSNYSDLPSEGVLLNFIALFTAFFGILVLYLVNDADFKRHNLPEDEVILTETE